MLPIAWRLQSGQSGQSQFGARIATPISPEHAAEVHDRAISIDLNVNEHIQLNVRFGGLSVKETAEVLSVSVETLMRDWNLARAWLHREMRHELTGGN